MDTTLAVAETLSVSATERSPDTNIHRHTDTQAMDTTLAVAEMSVSAMEQSLGINTHRVWTRR
jgi:hypothetical protein